jgi:hypothetical protein
VKEALPEDASLDIILAAITEPAQLPQSVAQKFKDYSLQKGLLLYCYTPCLRYSLKLKDVLNTNISCWKDIQQMHRLVKLR